MFKKLFFVVVILCTYTNTTRAQSWISEIENVAEDLSEIPEYDQPFQKYFTSYNLPEELQIPAETSLSFTVNSLSAGFIPKTPTKVTNTLYRIDIRDYEWTQQAWEDVYNIEPYFKYPWLGIQEVKKTYDFIITASGNSLMRLDWFIVNALDQTRQGDRQLDIRVYPTLLYAKSDKLPATLEEVRQFWGVDRSKIDGIGLAKGGVVDVGKSAVRRFAGTIYTTRTEVGYWTETYDSATEDYIEVLKADKSEREAAEAIGTNLIQLQIYALANGKEELIDFGDPTVVRDRIDGDDVRVRTPWSCIRCHLEGMNNVDNSVQNILSHNVQINVKDLSNARRLERFYNSDINSVLNEYKLTYINGVKAVTGLDPQQNLDNLEKIVNWYDKDLTLEQASLECGVEKSVFSDHIAKLTTSGRLAFLSQDGYVPRAKWDELNIGVFTKAMLTLYNLEVIETNQNNAELPKVPVEQYEQEASPILEIDTGSDDSDSDIGEPQEVSQIFSIQDRNETIYFDRNHWFNLSDTPSYVTGFNKWVMTTNDTKVRVEGRDVEIKAGTIIPTLLLKTPISDNRFRPIWLTNSGKFTYIKNANITDYFTLQGTRVKTNSPVYISSASPRIDITVPAGRTFELLSTVDNRIPDSRYTVYFEGKIINPPTEKFDIVR